MSRELKVGDRVLIARRVETGNFYWNDRDMTPLIGKVGTIQEGYNAEKTWRVKVEGETDGEWWYLRDSLELQEEAVSTIYEPLPKSLRQWVAFINNGGKLKFRSGCNVLFVAFENDAKPHCKLILLNPSTGNIVTRYASGKASTEPYEEPGDILVVEASTAP